MNCRDPRRDPGDFGRTQAPATRPLNSAVNCRLLLGTSVPVCSVLHSTYTTFSKKPESPQMAKRDRRSRRRAKAKTPPLPPEAAPVRPMHDEEAVDGILVQIHKREFTIAGEQAGQTQNRLGYEVRVAIPDWEMNRDLLKSVNKGYAAQQKLLAKLQREGARRPWLIQRFIEIDKAVAASLGTITERIRTRRWRERERGGALQRLQGTFGHLQRWTAKATRYCERAQEIPDPAEKETVLDAACLSILKIGELVNKVERMQHGFWEQFRAAHFLEMRHMRNLIGHTDDLEGEAVIPVGTGVCRDFQSALGRTLFPMRAGLSDGGFLIPMNQLRELDPTRPGGEVTPSNSIAMIDVDDGGRFVIHRVGRSADNRALISSSATGSWRLSVYSLSSRPGAGASSLPP